VGIGDRDLRDGLHKMSSSAHGRGDAATAATATVAAAVATAAQRWAKEVLAVIRRDDSGAEHWGGRGARSSSDGDECQSDHGRAGGAGRSGGRRWRVMRVVDACVTLLATLLSLLSTSFFGGHGDAADIDEGAARARQARARARTLARPASMDTAESDIGAPGDGDGTGRVWEVEEEEEEEEETRPVISFSGCGFAYPYQLGVARYLAQHFHADYTTRVRCAAHSAVGERVCIQSEYQAFSEVNTMRNRKPTIVNY